MNPEKARMWERVKREYLSGVLLKDIASKYKMSYAALRNKASKENWKAELNEIGEKALGKVKTWANMTGEEKVTEVCKDVRAAIEVDNFFKLNSCTTIAIDIAKSALEDVRDSKEVDTRELKDLTMIIEKLQNMSIISEERMKTEQVQTEGINLVVPDEGTKEEAVAWVE